MAFGLKATAACRVAELPMLFCESAQLVAPSRNRAVRPVRILCLECFVQCHGLLLLERGQWVTIRVPACSPTFWANLWPHFFSVLLCSPAHVRLHNTALVLQ